jgi:hypothetical protein
MNANIKHNWMGRNWKWFVPVLCLSFVALIFAAIFAIMSLVLGGMKSSGAYQQAVTRASANPAVIAALGQPIHTGYFTMGNISVSNDHGSAQLDIPLQGPKGEATVHLEARKSSNQWTYSALTVSLGSTNQQIDLLQDNSKTP